MSEAATTLLAGDESSAGDQQTGNQQTGDQQTSTGTGNQQTGGQDGGWNTLIREDGSLDSRWLDRLPEDLREAARPTLESVPSIEELARSYYNTKQMVGKRVTPPGEDAADEEVAKWRGILGVPDSPDGYKIAPPENMPEGLEWSDDTAAAFAALAHKHHIPPAAVQDMVQWHTEQLAAGMEQNEAADQQFLAGQQAALREKWGSEFDRNLGAAKQAASMAGLKADHPALVHADVVAALARLGTLLGEDNSAGTRSTTTGPGDEANRILSDESHPQHKAYWDASHPDHQAAVARFQELMRVQTEAAN